MSFARIVALVILASALVALAGCGIPPSFNYKLTLEVATEDGVKTASSVVMIHHGKVMITASGGIMTHARGEALYLDLGPGRRPLIALLTKGYEARRELHGWGEVSPFKVLAKAYGETFTDYGDRGEHLWTIARHRGVREIGPADLPDLVTFADVNDPKSVLAVDANDLEAALGPGIKWHRITIEITDEPITWGIEKRLRWLPKLDGALDGRRLRYYGAGATFANSLGYSNFVKR